MGRPAARGWFDATELVLEIVAGEGGDDSRRFARELLGAYHKYAAARGLTATLLDDDPAHLVAEVAGPGAGRAFRHEPGNHVVQRVPHTERHGRRQTSVVAVMVRPPSPSA